MTELMLRLIKDGKIVGEEWHRKVNGAKDITVWYRHEGEKEWYYSGDMEIDYDDFDRGIQVGGETWFSGDRLLLNGNKYVLEFTGEAWWLHGIGFDFDVAQPNIKLWLEDAKRIGNIHDKGTP